MKLPSEIKLGNRNIKVIVGKLDKNLMGQYDSTTLEISLNKELTQSQMVETFWHELVHAINDYNRVTVELATEIRKESGNADENAWDLEERMTENFSKVFLQVLQDNKLLGVIN